MALFRVDHSSVCVKVNLPLYLILPSPAHLKEKSLADFRVLYLLHGLSDDASAWQRYTNIEILARELDLAVIMPSGGRSMYIDMSTGQAYFSYLTEELPEYLSKLFKLNLTRANTAIAGLSMGGYGAFKAALLRPDLYCAAGSFSGVLGLQYLPRIEDESMRREFTLLFGELDQAAGGKDDPLVWLEQAAKRTYDIPRLYAACGKQDELLPINRIFRQRAQELGVPLTYVEEDGIHDWFFWQNQIAQFLRQFWPTQEKPA
ncbi:MAG TPA: alpha/beta hydrolase family protein [Anaerolineaceae bacterium]|mgnify:CR=1 FL=1|jgi:S-formylglutathione hydrolase FrmB|nr:esterase family protein [Anaerolineaceae bacterium]HOE34147.1 alpha/beta hydrolase family protein [Anaerolineaceae bacterium]HOT25144.1 alpha/beta hydrolase family protein [Anaerolineaceae bacterium]HQH57924.1 alpha/beta hydrolase family protein [Anaerolineaceae bacterium]HQK02795.1 alpha/beta hydrolase family protein [Anaerolineaceae bacterium]